MASRFFFMPGMAPPNGGPDAILIKGTKELNAVYEVSTGAEARTAVAGMADQGSEAREDLGRRSPGHVSKMTPEVYNAVIDEAHKRGMLVHAHAIQMADQKAVVRAGADVLVHTVQNEPIDEELMALLREKKPYWTTVIGLGDRSEACNGDPFVDETYPEKALEEIRAKDCAPLPPTAANRERILFNNLPKYIASGARLVLGTDAGIDARHAFGWADHHEMARWVQSGVAADGSHRCRHIAPGGSHWHSRSRDPCRRQERRLPGAHRQPARRHPQHAPDRQGLHSGSRAGPRENGTGVQGRQVTRVNRAA